MSNKSLPGNTACALVSILLPVLATALLLLAMASGCAGMQGDPRYVVDGVQYGVTDGAFRGRWWNHFERGRSFLAGGFLEEAESDFRTARDGRTEDTRWARTYGLRFLENYFPNRELGVTLYYQEAYDDAIGYLETSYAQTPSARAAHYLERTREVIVEERGLDREPPEIALVEPVPDQVVGETEVTLRGVARDDTYVRNIYIDGVRHPIDVTAPETSFERTVTLAPGSNPIVMAVEDIAGNVTEEEVTLYADLDGPSISFDAPVDIPGVVTGVAVDMSGVERVMVGDQPARLERVSDTMAEFRAVAPALEPGERMPYLAEDGLGNTTRGFLTAAADGASLEARERIQLASRAMSFLPVVSGTAMIGRAGLSIQALNLVSGQVIQDQKYLLDFEIVAEAPIDTVRVNGVEIPDIIPGRSRQMKSRRLNLEEEGEHTVTLEVRDETGETARESITITRQLNEIERVARLDVCVLGFSVESEVLPPLLQGAGFEDLVTDWMNSRLERRFILRERDPALFETVLYEQEVSALLGNPREVLAAQELIPAEMLLVGRIYWVLDSLEIILEGISTELYGHGEIVTIARAEAAGAPETRDGLEHLVDELAYRFLQEVPRVQGHVVDVHDNQVINTLGNALRVRPNQKAVIFKRGEPIPHPANPDITIHGAHRTLAEALIRDVDEYSSQAEILRQLIEEELGPYLDEVTELHIITK